MDVTVARRRDDALWAAIDQRGVFSRALGRNFAVSFLVEHYVTTPLLQRVSTEQLVIARTST